MSNMTSSQASELIQKLLGTRKGKYSPLGPLFAPHIEDLRSALLLPNGSIAELIFNANNGLLGPGKCLTCGLATKFYAARGGWSQYCSKKCMNAKGSARVKNSEKTKLINGTSIDSERVREKSENTLLSKYGVNNPSLVESAKVKRRDTCLQKFGSSSPLSSEAVKGKISNTMKTKYGGTGRQSKTISKKINDTIRKQILKNISGKFQEWELITETFAGTHEEKIKLKHNCGEIISKYLWTGQHSFYPRCPSCHGSSKPQQKVLELLKSLGEKTEVNVRSLIAPREIDILVPNRIAIEVNGIYFHGEKYGKDKKYHLTKTEECLKSGIQLLHFTDIEIEEKWNAVKHSICSKLGHLEKVDARKCTVKKISHNEARQFLETYHLQGSCQSSIRYGLFEGETLVSVMTFGKARYNKNYSYELLRFSSSKNVRGGAGKLLSAFRKEYKGSIISYADRRWSNGNMYHALGFSMLPPTPPGYRYVKDGKIFHRTAFQKHTLNGLPGQSEREIMLARGYDKIWDCGNLKFELV